jgi:hypothetical protein
MYKGSHDQAVKVALPTERDFDPFGDLDARHAWRNFGGLSVSEALRKFRENPIHYQEDFLFMGGRAFVFYFPVLDAFLREFRLSEQEDDSQAAIIPNSAIRGGSGAAMLGFTRHCGTKRLDQNDPARGAR